MKQFFFGGIHPKYHKEMSSGDAQITAVVPEQVVIPMRQHIGAPCKPLVQVGQYVRRGQKIGDGEGLCVPVHASVSGTVTAVEPRPHNSGQLVESVVIKNDFQDNCVPFVGCDRPLEQLDPDTVLRVIREAGIVGMGGAAFPSDVKAKSALGKMDTLIANACECEPYITADDSLLRSDAKQVLDGMMILHRVLAPAKMVLAIEDNKQEAIAKLQTWKQDYPMIEVMVLPTRYPQGSEKQLIQAVTGRQVPPSGLPVDVGCAVFNVSSYAAIYRAVRLGMPLMERIVTVSGEAVAKPQNFMVRIGTSFQDVIDAAGGLTENADRVLSGGPMMGYAQSDLSVPVMKAINCVLCLPKNQNNASNNPVCIRCGKCVAVCPMHLQPLYLYRFSKSDRVEELNRLHILDCIECGSCSFICPGKLPLVENLRLGKKIVKEAAPK